MIDVLEAVDKPPIIQDLNGPVYQVRKPIEASRPGEWDDPMYDKAQEMIKKTSVEMKKKYPGREGEIELLLDMFYGPYRLRKEVLQNGGALSEEDKLDSARIQHNQAQAIFLTSLEELSDVHIEEIYKMVRNFERITERFYEREKGVVDHWSCVRAEVSLMKAFREEGYNVYALDYVQDPDETNLCDNEILQMDIRGGIDLIVGKEGEGVYLIDSKGRTKYAKEDEYERVGQRGVVEISGGWFDISKFPQSIKTIIDSFRPLNGEMPKIEKIVMFVPVARNYLPSVDRNCQTVAQKRTALQKFAEMPEDIKSDLFNKLQFGQSVTYA